MGGQAAGQGDEKCKILSVVWSPSRIKSKREVIDRSSVRMSAIAT